MDERELIKRAQKLIRRYDNMKIVGSRGEWSGNARQGFNFNPLGGGGGGGGGTPSLGACCLEDGTCEVVTIGQCALDGGTFQGIGTTCDPNPCICICPRDVTEITGFRIYGTATFSPCGMCTDACSPLECPYEVTWTRIPYTDSYSAPHQFKMWVDEDCNLQFENNGGLSNLDDGLACSTTGPHFPEFGLDNLHSSMLINAFGFTPGSPQLFTIGFTASGSSNCFFDVCAPTFPNTDYEVDYCDLSSILGTYSISDTVTDINGSIMYAEGNFEIN